MWEFTFVDKETKTKILTVGLNWISVNENHDFIKMVWLIFLWYLVSNKKTKIDDEATEEFESILKKKRYMEEMVSEFWIADFESHFILSVKEIEVPNTVWELFE